MSHRPLYPGAHSMKGPDSLSRGVGWCLPLCPGAHSPVARPLPEPIFLHSCKIKSWSGLAMGQVHTSWKGLVRLGGGLEGGGSKWWNLQTSSGAFFNAALEHQSLSWKQCLVQQIPSWCPLLHTETEIETLSGFLWLFPMVYCSEKHFHMVLCGSVQYSCAYMYTINLVWVIRQHGSLCVR